MAPIPDQDDELLPEEVELLHSIAGGHSVFHARERDSEPMWLRTLNRLALLRELGLIEFRESVREGGDGMPLLIGPCELTAAGRVVVERYPAPGVTFEE
jgi:hypothetical protein